MAKTRNITDKLSFDENPALIICDKKLEVNADAPTMLKIMGLMGDSGLGMDQIVEAYELVFPEESRKAIEKMKLSVNDWITVVEEAMNLIIDDGKNQGER
jgi:hypothetical protein